MGYSGLGVARFLGVTTSAVNGPVNIDGKETCKELMWGSGLPRKGFEPMRKVFFHLTNSFDAAI